MMPVPRSIDTQRAALGGSSNTNTQAIANATTAAAARIREARQQSAAMSTKQAIFGSTGFAATQSTSATVADHIAMLLRSGGGGNPQLVAIGARPVQSSPGSNPQLTAMSARPAVVATPNPQLSGIGTPPTPVAAPKQSPGAQSRSEGWT